ncbi:hypothetical protein PHMEG_00041961, partial [Phytophthora megakarya]
MEGHWGEALFHTVQVISNQQHTTTASGEESAEKEGGEANATDTAATVNFELPPPDKASQRQSTADEMDTYAPINMTEFKTLAHDVTSDSDDGFQDFLSDEEEHDTLVDQESVALEHRMKTVRR